jgi:hypothetical protein
VSNQFSTDLNKKKACDFVVTGLHVLVRLAEIELTIPWFLVNTNFIPKETTVSVAFILFITNQ